MDTFGYGYIVVWSIGAVTVGIVGLFFRKWFLKFCEKGYMSLYRKTKLSFFERAAKEFTMPYMNLLVIFLAILFMILGINTLLRVI
ncbi:MAG: hypothetical protein QG566_471 [Patescibacteria group bacterium]|jgi:amino acid transporter|nr:hypothetical protein [Patescibacteria group bacterium]